MEVSDIILIMSMIYYNYPENIMNIHQATQVNATLLTFLHFVQNRRNIKVKVALIATSAN